MNKTVERKSSEAAELRVNGAKNPAIGAALAPVAIFASTLVLAADEKPAAPAPTPAPAATSSGEEILFSDDFNTAGTIGERTSLSGVAATDVADGHVTLQNNYPEGEYKEMPGSPCVLESFKESAPFQALIYKGGWEP